MSEIDAQREADEATIRAHYPSPSQSAASCVMASSLSLTIGWERPISDFILNASNFSPWDLSARWWSINTAESMPKNEGIEAEGTPILPPKVRSSGVQEFSPSFDCVNYQRSERLDLASSARSDANSDNVTIT
jgi:hypothetical protein